jgi:hypothetical protein
MTGDFPLGRAVLAKAQAIAGKRVEAEETLSALTKLSEVGEIYVPAYGIALIHDSLSALRHEILERVGEPQTDI